MAANRALLEEQAKVFKALGHPDRLLMVTMIAKERRCVSDLQKAVGSEMSTISKHLSVLREAGIIKGEKEKNQIFYSLELPCLKDILLCTCKVTHPDTSSEFKGIPVKSR